MKEGDEVYRTRQLLRRAMEALRECEDHARLVRHDNLLAGRVREIHESLTKDVINGSSAIASSAQRLHAIVTAVEPLLNVDDQGALEHAFGGCPCKCHPELWPEAQLERFNRTR